MNILALETSSEACSVALLKSRGTAAADEIISLHKIAPMQHTSLILPLIKELLASASLTLNQLDAIAYGEGPGSLTGVRIANSVAQAISFAADLPIIQISSLLAMSQITFIDHGRRKLLAAVSAHNQQIHWAVYEVNAFGLAELIGEELLCQPEEILLQGKICETEWYGIGNGWQKYADRLINSLGFQPSFIYDAQLPHAAGILAAAKKTLGNEVVRSKSSA